MGVAVTDEPDDGGRGVLAAVSVVEVGVVGEVGPGRLAIQRGQGLRAQRLLSPLDISVAK